MYLTVFVFNRLTDDTKESWEIDEIVTTWRVDIAKKLDMTLHRLLFKGLQSTLMMELFPFCLLFRHSKSDLEYSSFLGLH